MENIVKIKFKFDRMKKREKDIRKLLCFTGTLNKLVSKAKMPV